MFALLAVRGSRPGSSNGDTESRGRARGPETEGTSERRQLPMRLSPNRAGHRLLHLPGSGAESHPRDSEREEWEEEPTCREVRIARHVTEGTCVSARPLKQVLCSGHCTPSRLLSNLAVAAGTRPHLDRDRRRPAWRCVPGQTRVARVPLNCPGGHRRTARVMVASACRCKRAQRRHNESRSWWDRLDGAAEGEHENSSWKKLSQNCF
ncbi:sclerostin domain-containing protein 1-like [Lethenteron reissneri]|uniref:sclerostin domain-containing protein 1-like n=1 Tax=Lethenteron reissneri TaxID=7753 RepID=UPI002AB733C6|nr:sclerostin domain-containing protein 1-like [Lethenteron reissneri]